MTRAESPPRLARLLVGVATDREDRDWILADLDELYARHCRNIGRAGANRWYWSQAIRSAAPLIRRRFADRPQVQLHGAYLMPANQERLPDRRGLATYYLRHAVRRLIREPAFTAAAALTLSLGVGANVAVFAVVEAVLLRPLPFPQPEQLAILNYRDTRTGIAKEFVAQGDMTDIAKRSSAFESLGQYNNGSSTIFFGGDPVMATRLDLAPAAAKALRLRIALGRGIEASDGVTGAAPVVILGDHFWRNRFGADRSVLGRIIRTGTIDRTIVGVAEPGFGFRGIDPADLIAPIVTSAQAAQQRGNWVLAVGRLNPGKSIADGTADVARIAKQLEAEYPARNTGTTYFTTSVRDAMVGNTKPALLLLLSAVSVVLLIACANVANLLLARSLGRRREMAVRLALGAGRGRLAIQLFSESLVLAVVAATFSVLFAFWGAKALVALVPESVRVPGLTDVHINGPVLGFAIGITLLTTIVFGLVALLTVRADGTASVLVGAGRMSMGRGARRTTSAVVVAEVALAIVLLIGAGLIMRSFAELVAVDPGFVTQNVLTMNVGVPLDRYPTPQVVAEYNRTLTATVRAIPGVIDVGAAAVTPLTGNNWTTPFERLDSPVPAGQRAPDVGWQNANGGYFKALRIPLVAGRLFNEFDGPGSEASVIVSQAIEKTYFNGESAVGKRVRLGDSSAVIVGVVGNIRRASLRDDPRADMYFPLERSPSRGTTLFIRTASDPERMIATVQSALKGIEPRTVFSGARSLEQVAAESLRLTKLLLWLLAVFAAAAVLLAAVGIYGVMSYVVRQRTGEIGMRIALGASRSNIHWMVMRDGAALAATGTVVGLAVGALTSRVLSSVLFHVTATDPLTYMTAPLALIGTILLASYVPARRAAGVDPVKSISER